MREYTLGSPPYKPGFALCRGHKELLPCRVQKANDLEPTLRGLVGDVFDDDSRPEAVLQAVWGDRDEGSCKKCHHAADKCRQGQESKDITDLSLAVRATYCVHGESRRTGRPGAVAAYHPALPCSLDRRSGTRTAFEDGVNPHQLSGCELAVRHAGDVLTARWPICQAPTRCGHRNGRRWVPKTCRRSNSVRTPSRPFSAEWWQGCAHRDRPKSVLLQSSRWRQLTNQPAASVSSQLT